MIYLIITASLQNNVVFSVLENRVERYRNAIRETLCHIPEGIEPILVENTSGGTWNEEWWCHGRKVPIVFTENGKAQMRNKGVNEWLDIQQVIREWGMKDEDIIVKLTGRYRLLSSPFLETIQKTEKDIDAWFRFLNVCTMEDDPMDCVLGAFASRVSVIRYISWSWINLFDSPEKAIAKYIRFSVSPHRIMEMKHLDVECIFSENGRVLIV